MSSLMEIGISNATTIMGTLPQPYVFSFESLHLLILRHRYIFLGVLIPGNFDIICEIQNIVVPVLTSANTQSFVTCIGIDFIICVFEPDIDGAAVTAVSAADSRAAVTSALDDAVHCFECSAAHSCDGAAGDRDGLAKACAISAADSRAAA